MTNEPGGAAGDQETPVLPIGWAPSSCRTRQSHIRLWIPFQQLWYGDWLGSRVCYSVTRRPPSSLFQSLARLDGNELMGYTKQCIQNGVPHALCSTTLRSIPHPHIDAHLDWKHTLSSWKVPSAAMEIMPMLPSDDADAKMRPTSCGAKDRLLTDAVCSWDVYACSHAPSHMSRVLYHISGSQFSHSVALLLEQDLLWL